MQIPEHHFEEFKRLMRKHFGDERVDQMTEGELYEKAIKLIRFVEIVERPDQTEEDGETGAKATAVRFETD